MSIKNNGTQIRSTYKPQSEANAATMMPQTGPDVMMDLHGTAPLVTCGECIF